MIGIPWWALFAGEDWDSHSARRRNGVDFLLKAGLVLNTDRSSRILGRVTIATKAVLIMTMMVANDSLLFNHIVPHASSAGACKALFSCEDSPVILKRGRDLDPI